MVVILVYLDWYGCFEMLEDLKIYEFLFYLYVVDVGFIELVSLSGKLVKILVLLLMVINNLVMLCWVVFVGFGISIVVIWLVVLYFEVGELEFVMGYWFYGVYLVYVVYLLNWFIFMKVC